MIAIYIFFCTYHICIIYECRNNKNGLVTDYKALSLTVFEKMAKLANLAKFGHIIKFSKYITYYNPCDPKFSSVPL